MTAPAPVTPNPVLAALKQYAVFIGVLCLLAGIGALVARHYSGALAAAQKAVAAADARAVTAAARSVAAEARADSSVALAAYWQRMALKSKTAEGTDRTRLAVAVRAAADTCKAVIAAAQAAIAQDDSTVVATDSALAETQLAAGASRADADTLRAALGSLRHAAGNLVKRSGTPFLVQITPHPFAGIMAGVNPFTGKPGVVAGVGLGWKL